MPILNEADIHLQEGRVDVAIQIYQEALAANPAEIDAIKGLARCAEVLGLGRQAEEAWLQVHQIDPQDLDGPCARVSNISVPADIRKQSDVSPTS